MELIKNIIFYKDERDLGEKKGLVKKLHFAYIITVLVCMGLCIGIVSLLLASPYVSGFGKTGNQLFASYFGVPWLVVLNILPPVLLVLFFYFVSGRAWIGFTVPALFVVGVSAINYYKIKLRNDPLYFKDIQYAAEANSIVSNYSLELSTRVIVAILGLVLGILFAVFLMRGPLKNVKVRVFGSLAVFVVSGILYTAVYTNDSLYNKVDNSENIDVWSELQVYMSKGFLYPFLHSIKDAFPSPPEDYSAAKAQELLSRYTYDAIGEDEQINVISIMLEAYSDLSKFGVLDFEVDVYDKLHKLQEESFSGNLISNTFAGGTTNSEHAFLTGYTHENDYRTNTNSYVYYFREQGYYTEGFHAGDSWFYNRKNVNEYLGFENYYFLEDFDDADRTDKYFFSKVTELFENRDKAVPYFSYSLSFQNHGAYPSETTSGTAYINNNAHYSEATYNILNNYLEGIYDTTERIYAFIDQFRDLDEPVVIVLFGDHMPWLGDNGYIYDELGINTDLSSDEGFYNYYSTPYVIWANEAAKETADSDFTGQGDSISACFLMEQLFELCGWEGNEFMKASKALKEHTDILSISTGYFHENGISQNLSDTAQAAVDDFYKIEYYLKNNFLYRDLK